MAVDLSAVSSAGQEANFSFELKNNENGVSISLKETVNVKTSDENHLLLKVLSASLVLNGEEQVPSENPLIEYTFQKEL